MATHDRARTATAVVLYTLVAGCAPGGDASESPPAATYAEELRVGVAEGADEYMIGDINEIAVSEAGTIYAADRQVGLVRIYSPEGEFLGNVGGAGEGPGEYRRVHGLVVLPDNRLALLDGSQSRVILYSPHGGHVGDFPTTRANGFSLETDPAGHLLVRTQLRSDEGHETNPYGPSGYEVFHPDGTHLETIVAPPPELPPGGDPFVLNVGYWLEAFTVREQRAWSPHGYFLTAVNDRYEIDAVLPTGERSRLVSRDISPPALLEPERQQWEAIVRFMRDRWALMGYPTDAPELGDVKPYFREILAGHDGRFWTWRYVEVSEGAPHPGFVGDGRPELTWREFDHVYDGFTPTGEFIGSVTLPLMFVPKFWRGDHVWGAYEDDAGTRFILRLRLEPSLN